LEGCEVSWWETGSDALAALRGREHDLVVCDIRLPDMRGGDLYRHALREAQVPPFLFITAYADIDEAVELMRAGASDYLTKPFVMDDFLHRVEAVLSRRPQPVAADRMLGVSDAMAEVEALLRRLADIDSTVLLSGETGVGKEVCAQLLHQVSQAASEPFVAVNCAAIPSELLESELLGHEKGAFTGAHARHLGFAERAGSGILFLDEIAELPMPLQAKLLRLVQERSFHRIGGERAIDFRARLVCATNRDLEQAVRDGAFREDLYFRINVIPIHVPPLRERADDILPLLHEFAGSFAAEMGRDLKGASSLAEDAVLAHDWPGNVRELRNRVERAVALARGDWLTPGDLFPELGSDTAAGDAMATLAEVRDAAERRQILRALAATDRQIVKAAGLLGISRTTLWEKMRRLGLGPERPQT
jgi:DNA-binding NtrC family response regulator